jgi:hypothetical protein
VLTCVPHWLVQDLERLRNLAVSPIDQKLRQYAQESVSLELSTSGATQSPKRNRLAQREARASAAATVAAAQQTQCNLCLAKTLSWARDQAAAALCKSSESQCALSKTCLYFGPRK